MSGRKVLAWAILFLTGTLMAATIAGMFYPMPAFVLRFIGLQVLLVVSMLVIAAIEWAAREVRQ